MRIAYWSTCSLEAGHEAVSQEVQRLVRAFPGSWILATSPHYAVRFSWAGRYAGLHHDLAIALRLLAPILERAFDVSHVYGDLTPWVFHKALRARPIVHTVTQDSPDPVLAFLERCAAIVVQTGPARERMLGLGIPAQKVHLRYPGIDLRRFVPTARFGRGCFPPRVLFASAPRAAEELGARGVNLLLDAAQANPDVSFLLLFRRWRTRYTSLEPTRAAIAARRLSNVELRDGDVSDMPSIFAQSDLTVVPYTAPGGGKDCPNSAIESLACGVPVLVSRLCPLAQFVEENGCGVAFEPTPQALGEAIRSALSSWPQLSARARPAAEAHFDVDQLLRFYDGLYRSVRVLTDPRPPTRSPREGSGCPPGRAPSP